MTKKSKKKLPKLTNVDEGVSAKKNPVQWAITVLTNSYKANIWAMVGAMALTMAPLILVVYLMVTKGYIDDEGAISTDIPSSMLLFALAMYTLTAYLSVKIQIGLFRLFSSYINGGDKFTIEDIFIESKGRFWSFVMASFLLSLGIFAGLVLLIIPGVILMLRWMVALPVNAIEDKPALEAFRRSRKLTDGNFKYIAQILLVLFFFMIGLAFMLLIPFIGLITYILLMPAAAISPVVIYELLKRR